MRGIQIDGLYRDSIDTANYSWYFWTRWQTQRVNAEKITLRCDSCRFREVRVLFGASSWKFGFISEQVRVLNYLPLPNTVILGILAPALVGCLACVLACVYCWKLLRQTCRCAMQMRNHPSRRFFFIPVTHLEPLGFSLCGGTSRPLNIDIMW